MPHCSADGRSYTRKGASVAPSLLTYAAGSVLDTATAKCEAASTRAVAIMKSMSPRWSPLDALHQVVEFPINILD